MLRRNLTVLSLAFLAVAASAESRPIKPPRPACVKASDKEVAQINEALQAALAEKDEEKKCEGLANVFFEMESLRHDSFVPHIVKIGLKASDNNVLATAIRAAAAHELKDQEKNIRKQLYLKKKDERKMVSGVVGGAAIDYLARLGIPGEEKTAIEDFLKQLLAREQWMSSSWSSDLARACIDYFGTMKYKPAVPVLIKMVDEPFPENVNSPTNPPASYWKARVLMWQKNEGWVRWALKEITGKEFRLEREWANWLKDQPEKEYALK